MARCCPSSGTGRLLLGVVLLGLGLGTGSEAIARPKYGPEGAPKAIPLNRDREYFKRADAPDFWRLMPYYVPQFNGAACGVASVSMVLNGMLAQKTHKIMSSKGGKSAPSGKKSSKPPHDASAGMPSATSSGAAIETSEDKLVLQAELLDKVKAEDWKKRILGGDGVAGVLQKRGTDLDALARIMSEAVKQYDFGQAQVEALHVEGADSAWIEKVRGLLRENEASDRDFIIANFIQAEYTDDADVGHLAPVGAYDAKTDRVLVLDPDREYYEPYWVKVDTFVKGMATEDTTVKKKRGLLRVKLP